MKGTRGSSFACALQAQLCNNIVCCILLIKHSKLSLLFQDSADVIMVTPENSIGATENSMPSESNDIPQTNQDVAPEEGPTGQFKRPSSPSPSPNESPSKRAKGDLSPVNAEGDKTQDSMVSNKTIF